MKCLGQVFGGFVEPSYSLGGSLFEGFRVASNLGGYLAGRGI